MPPIPIPTALAPGDYPLLAKHGGGEADRLVGRYAAALAELAAVQADRQLAPLVPAGRFDDAIKPLADARVLLTKQRYTVGCIGITQAGKSTTINSILGEEVCKPGSGDACSSQPSRIVYADRRAIDVEFLTPGRLAARRQLLCEQIGLATPEDDAQLLPRLDRPDDFRDPDGPDRPRLKEDLAYLRAFLTAYRTHKAFVTDAPRVLSDLPYGNRDQYTTHTPNGPGAEILLVREARFRIDNKLIPADLELCDLPGLDSKRSVDDIVTWEYLPELDGTFLFVNVGGNLLTAGMLGIFSRLQKVFEGKLGGRAWLIFNKMDTLTEAHFRPGGQNIFVTIGKVLEMTGIPETQVCFCSKKLWDAAVKTGGTAERVFAAQTMSQTADAPVPPVCPAGLRPAWQELLKDGGISNLRSLMFREVAEALAAQLRRDADRLLDAFSAALAQRVAVERKRLAMGTTELQAAATCYGAVLQIRTALASRPHEFPALISEGDRLRQELAGVFDRGSPPELLANLTPADLARQFRTHARVLAETLDNELTGEVLDRAYQMVGERLDGLPPVGLGPDQRSCRDVWQGFALADRADEGWRADLPRFGSDDLAAWLARPGGDGVDGAVYAELIHDKIDVAVGQTVHLIRARLRRRLGEIEGELSVLTGERDPAAG